MKSPWLPAVLILAACARQPAPTPAPAPRPANAADVEFMSGMIHHHQQAIDMAQWAPTHQASESLQRLAERIKVAQSDEIRMMTAWLHERGQQPMQHKMMMPGMLTDEQMAQLDRSRGMQFDSLFLTFMIQHHRGALTMVDKLLASYGAAQDETVFRFSSDVVADQTTEIERMQRMLEALGRN